MQIRFFAQLFPDVEIHAQAVREFPWGHIVFIINRVVSSEGHGWYAELTVKFRVQLMVLVLNAINF